MPVTELATLHLLPPTTSSSPPLVSALAHAKQVMESYTDRTFYILQQIEDPTMLYIIGEWASVSRHMNNFVPSRENQSMLEQVKGLLEVTALEHLDVPLGDLPIGKGAGVFSIGRHYIKAGKREEFVSTFQEGKGNLEEHVTQGKINGGWRVDKENEKDELVLFCPWKSTDEHYGFAKTEEFGKYMAIKEWIDGAETKHAKVLELEV